MNAQTSTGPVIFKESEYSAISEALPRLYHQLCRELFGPSHNLNHAAWLTEFTAFKNVIALSMCNLRDDDLARVNNCQFTLLPLVTYHEVTSRLCRELEEYFNGVREKLSFVKVVANALELRKAREDVGKAWKRDLRAGALAGPGRGHGRSVDGV
jgi:hypothetical protein